MCSAPSSQHEHFPIGPRLRCRPEAGAGARRAQPCRRAGGQAPGPGPTVRVTVLGFLRRVTGSRLYNRQIRNRTRTDLEPPLGRRRAGLAASESDVTVSGAGGSESGAGA